MPAGGTTHPPATATGRVPGGSPAGANATGAAGGKPLPYPWPAAASPIGNSLPNGGCACIPASAGGGGRNTGGGIPSGMCRGCSAPPPWGQAVCWRAAAAAATGGGGTGTDGSGGGGAITGGSGGGTMTTAEPAPCGGFCCGGGACGTGPAAGAGP